MQELVPGVTWLNECYDMGDRHEHVSVYLLTEPATERSVLVDTGSFVHREAITEQVERGAPAGLDALVLSHSDYPHSANVDRFAPEGSDVKLVASSTSPLAQGLPRDATRVSIGETLAVAGRDLTFIDPPLADRSHTTWVYDHQTRGLFVADGFGSYHQDGECAMTSRDFPEGIPEKAIHDFHAETLTWLQYVDPEKLRRALDAIVDAYPPAYVAPIHGHPILEADLEGYLERLVGAARKISGAEGGAQL